MPPARSRAARRALATLLAVAAACGGDSTPTPTAQASTTARADSQYLPAVMAARFRARVPEHPTHLGDGAATDRDTLVARYVRALERADTAAFRRMRLSVSEFAWLYYLDAPLAQQPYALDPEVMWTQITAQSDRGLSRAVERFGGRPFGLTAATCKPATPAGGMRLHTCEVVGREITLPLSLVERDGWFKFVGYGNQL